MYNDLSLVAVMDKIVSMGIYIIFALSFLVMFYGFYRQAKYKKLLRQVGQDNVPEAENFKKNLKKYGKVSGWGFVLFIFAGFMWLVFTFRVRCGIPDNSNVNQVNNLQPQVNAEVNLSNLSNNGTCDIGIDTVPYSKLDDYNCGDLSGCKWKLLGGKKESVYACCPQELSDASYTSKLSTEEIESIMAEYDRCFIRID